MCPLCMGQTEIYQWLRWQPYVDIGLQIQNISGQIQEGLRLGDQQMHGRTHDISSIVAWCRLVLDWQCSEPEGINKGVQWDGHAGKGDNTHRLSCIGCYPHLSNQFLYVLPNVLSETVVGLSISMVFVLIRGLSLRILRPSNDSSMMSRSLGSAG